MLNRVQINKTGAKERKKKESAYLKTNLKILIKVEVTKD
jgi:hypothetical protein